MTQHALLPGRATAEGTDRFRRRFAQLGAGHFRPALDLTLSSIGIGTYLGEADEDTDRGYLETVGGAPALGCNVIDSAINYRYQFSERVVGRAVRAAIASGVVRRDELVLCTKGGYLSFDGPPSNARAWVEATLIEPGVCTWADIVAHNVMVPAYIRHQLQASLDNLGLETIDVYYLHNPESQIQGLSRQEFMGRMTACFAELEVAASAGLVGCYGVATWDAFRVDPDHQAHVSIEALVKAALSVGGPAHHFRAIQLPVNLGMPEAFVRATQSLDGSPVTALEAAGRLGLTVVASGALMQGRLASLPAGFVQIEPGAASDAQRALQFARSVPGIATALVGTKTPAHLREDMALASLPPLAVDAFVALFDEHP